MNRTIALGALWGGPLLARLEAELAPWTLIPGAGTDTDAARDATVLIPFGMRVDRALLQGSRIRLIQQYGVGVDTLDLDAARQLGIPVANAPSDASGMAASVAECAVLLVLSCARLPSLRNERLAERRWSWQVPFNLGLAGRTAGLIGLGSIGTAIARRLRALDMRLIGVRRSPVAGEKSDLGFDWIAGLDHLDQLASEADMLVVSVPLTKETHGLVGQHLLSRIKPGASLVNVGRGGVVDEDALLRALDEGRMHAAGLDTVQQEPLPPESPLLHHPRVIVTPHDAGATDVAFRGLANIIRDNLTRLEQGREILHRLV